MYDDDIEEQFPHAFEDYPYMHSELSPACDDCIKDNCEIENCECSCHEVITEDACCIA